MDKEPQRTGDFIARTDAANRRLVAMENDAFGLVRRNDRAAAAKVGGWEVEVETKEVRWTRETHRIHDIPEGQTFDVSKAVLFTYSMDQG